VDLIMNQNNNNSVAGSNNSTEEDVESLSGKILSGSMDLQPPEQRAKRAAGSKRNQKEADLLSGSVVDPNSFFFGFGSTNYFVRIRILKTNILTPKFSKLCLLIAFICTVFWNLYVREKKNFNRKRFDFSLSSV
jgi:hypothetical protein